MFAGSHRQSIGEDHSEKKHKHNHITSELSHEENSLENIETITPVPSVDVLPTHDLGTLLDKDNGIVSEPITKDMTVTPLIIEKVKKRRSLPATSTPQCTEEENDIPKKKRRSLGVHQDSLLIYSKPKVAVYFK